MYIYVYDIPEEILYLTYKDKLLIENTGFINSYKLEFYMDNIFKNEK